MAISGTGRVVSGSACTSASLEPSYVLRALGLQRRVGAQLYPFHPGPLQTTEKEVDLRH